MTVKRNVFDVEYQTGATIDEADEWRVRVIMADRLNVEMRGKKYGLLDPAKQPQLVGFLWIYFACLREGRIPDDLPFAEFQERCLDNSALETEEVPPTPEGSSDSASSSLSTSPMSTGATS